jgi:DNA-binding Xre family transcriptional regulator
MGQQESAGEGHMVITLKEYLDKLQGFERRKPEEQRQHVPTMEELAGAVGIHPVTLSNIANNKIKHLNLDTGARIVRAMRDFGFPMRTTDLVEYREAAMESDRVSA